MKKIITILLILTICAAFCACGAEVVQTDDTIEFIGADSTGKGAAGQLFGELVAKKTKELTNGKFTIDYHPNGELGGDTDLIRQMQANDIQLVVCQTAPMVSFIPEMAVFDLPMVFSKYDGGTIDSVLNGENEFSSAMRKAYNNAGLELMGFLQNATYRMTTANVELKTLGDFRSLQIRTMENKNHMMFWSAIGAEPTPLPWPELYLALQNGTVDAQENAADTCAGANFQEVQKYLVCTNHILYCNQICMNKEAYDSLPEEYRQALNTAVKEAIEEMRLQLKTIDEESKQTLIDGGMQLIEYDDSFYDEILALNGVKALYDDINNSQANGLGTLLTESLSNG